MGIEASSHRRVANRLRWRRAVGVCVAIIAGLAASAGAGAQSVRLSGRVYVSGDTLRPVANAEISLLPGLRVVRTDSSGAFRFVDTAPGQYTLRARRVGFEVATLDIAIRASQNRDVRIAMRANAQALSEITVAGRRVMFPARYSDAYTRVAQANGTFFTRELIDSLQPYDVKSLFARIPGVQVNDRSVVFQRCQTGAALGSEAHIQVYVDGVRVTNYALNGFGYDASTALQDIVMSSVQLIEVYQGVSRIPAEYLDDACAVVLIWHK